MTGLALLLLALPAPAQLRCELSGRRISLEGVEVAPMAGPQLPVNLHGVSARIETDAESAIVHVDGALVFDGRVAASAVPYRLRRAVRLGEGSVRLPAGAGVRVLEGGLQAEVARDVTVVVTLGCEDLTLEGRSVAPAASPRGATPRRLLLPSGPILHLRATPEASAALELRLGPAADLPLAGVEQRGELVHVRARWSTGTAIDGWAAAQELAEVHVRPAAREPSVVGQGCGYGTGGRTYQGPARILAGTSVELSPGTGTAWATVVREVAATVAIGTDPTWAHVLTLPGITPADPCPPELEHAWVETARLRLPARVARQFAAPAPAVCLPPGVWTERCRGSGIRCTEEHPCPPPRCSQTCGPPPASDRSYSCHQDGPRRYRCSALIP